MRKAELARKTSETDIKMSLNIDGKGSYDIKTGIEFFDHMLNGFAKHGFFDLKVKVDGDIGVDGHHTVEDTGIVLGNAIKEACKDTKGMARFGYFILPMDDALVLCSIDFSGRPYLNFEANFNQERCGYFETELVKEFFYAVSYAAEMNIHIKQLSGDNNHHIIEAAFKAFANAVKEATRMDERLGGNLLSTKGAL